jgi:hypothetical protein
MAANLFGERFSGRRPAWHELGLVNPDGWSSAKEAFTAGRLDYKIELLPLVGKTGKKQIEVPNKFGLFREPVPDDDNWAYLGMAGSGYRLLQNMDVAEMIDDLGLPKRWPVNTVGAIGSGETLFVTLDAGSTEIAGEEIINNFLVADTRDAKSAMRFAFVPLDVVCSNTMMAGLRAATKLDRVTHTKGIEIEARDKVALFGGLEKAKDDTLLVFSRLAKLKVDNTQIQAAIEVAYPDPVLPSRLMTAHGKKDTVEASPLGMWAPAALEKAQFEYNREVGRVNKLREECIEKLFEQNDTRPLLANTAWGVFQAVCDRECFRDGPSSMYASVLLGERATTMARTLDHLAELK